MGNDLTQQVLYIDTAAVVFASAKQLGKIVWSNMTSGDDVIIEDENGKVIFSAKSPTNNAVIEFDFKGMLAGFEVATIDSGLLMYYPYMGNF